MRLKLVQRSPLKLASWVYKLGSMYIEVGGNDVKLVSMKRTCTHRIEDNFPFDIGDGDDADEVNRLFVYASRYRLRLN